MPFKKGHKTTKKKSKDKEKKSVEIKAKSFKVFATRDVQGRVKENGEYKTKEVRVPIPITDTIRRYASLSKGGAVEVSAKGTDNVIRAIKLFTTLQRRNFKLPDAVCFSFEDGYVQLRPTIIEGVYNFVER